MEEVQPIGQKLLRTKGSITWRKGSAYPTRFRNLFTMKNIYDIAKGHIEIISL